MATAQKLTKKQKKAVAFRDRKSGKRKPNVAEVEDNAVPVMEEQDIVDVPTSEMEVGPVEKKKRKGSGEAERKGSGTKKDDVVEKSKKRKRETTDVDVGQGEEQGEQEKKEATKVKRKKVDDNTKEKELAKQRFILFVGNLKYTTTKEAIQTHFAACDPPPTIRLLTPKPSSSKTQINKSKGCAFLEFTHRNALQQALKLHQSNIDGRMINVELTAGGGGKSSSRIEKVKERNKALLDQRKLRLETSDANNSLVLPIPDKPQRYSSTSGIEQAPVVKRTWTVGEEDDGEVHRGGKKHAKASKSRPSRSMDWATGVNAIPVG